MALPPIRKYQTLRSSVKVPAGSKLGFTPGRGYYAAAPKAVKPGVVKPGVVKPPPATRMAGLYGGIGPNAYVNNLYAPQEQQLASQQAARMAGYQQLVKEFAASLATLGQGLAPYEAAAQSQTGTAAAAAAGLSASNPNAQTQAALAAIGAPDAQRAQVANQNQTVFGGGADLLNYVGGTIPADVFRQDAAGRAAYLAALPAIGQSSALQGLTQLNALASQDTSRLGAAKAQALQQAHSTLADYVQKNQALKQNAALAERAWPLKVAGVTGYLPDGTPTAATVRANQAAAAASARLKQSAAARASAAKRPNAGLSRLMGVLVDGNGNYIPGKDGNPVSVKNPSSTAKNVSVGLSKVFGFLVDASGNPIKRGGRLVTLPDASTTKPKFSATKVQQYKGDALTIAEGAYNGVPDPDPAKALPKLDYHAAALEMQKHGIPATYYLPILNRIYKPGSRGRPLPSDKVLAADLARKMGWSG